MNDAERRAKGYMYSGAVGWHKKTKKKATLVKKINSSNTTSSKSKSKGSKYSGAVGSYTPKTKTPSQASLNAMTPEKAKSLGYKWSGSAGWVKKSQLQKESEKRVSLGTPERPKYKTQVLPGGSISQQQINTGGFKFSGATGQLSRIPATKENTDMNRQYLRDLNVYYRQQLNIEKTRPQAERNSLIYNIDGQTVTHKEYIKTLESARSEVVKIQKDYMRQSRQSKTPTTLDGKKIKVTLPNEKTLAQITPSNSYFNDSTRTDIQGKHKDVFTREQQIEREVSKMLYQSATPTKKAGLKTATALSYRGKRYLGSILGSSHTGQKLGLSGTNKAGHINTPDDVMFDLITEVRGTQMPKKNIDMQLSGELPLTAPPEVLRQEQRKYKRQERSLYVKNVVTNPLTEITIIASAPHIIGTSPMLSAFASNPAVMLGGAFLGAKEVSRLKIEFDKGNKADAIGGGATLSAGLIGGVASKSALNLATKKTLTLNSIKSTEHIKTLGDKSLIAGRGHARYKVSLTERAPIDKLFHRPGKIRHEVVRGRLDVLSDKKGTYLKADFLDPKLKSQLVHVKQGKISPDKVISDVVKMRSTSPHRISETRVSLIDTHTRTRTSITPLKDTATIRQQTASLNHFSNAKGKHTLINVMQTTQQKPIQNARLSDIVRNLNVNRAGKTVRETSILHTTAKRTTVTDILHTLNPKTNKPHVSQHRTRYKTAHRSKETVVKLDTPQKPSYPQHSKGLSLSGHLKHQPTPQSRPTYAQKGHHISMAHSFNNLGSITKVQTPRLSAKATASKVLSNKRTGSLNVVSKHSRTSYKNSQLDMILNNIPGVKPGVKTPTVPHTKSTVVAEHTLKSASQSALRNAYLHKPAVNTGNFGRIAMTSLNTIAITQNKESDKERRISRVIPPSRLTPTKQPPKLRNNLINPTLSRFDLQNPFASKTKTSQATKKPTKTPQPIDIFFNPRPHPSINRIPKIDNPTPRIVRIGGTSKKMRIPIKRQSKAKNTDLNTIERQLKDINAII